MNNRRDLPDPFRPGWIRSQDFRSASRFQLLIYIPVAGSSLYDEGHDTGRLVEELLMIREHTQLCQRAVRHPKCLTETQTTTQWLQKAFFGMKRNEIIERSVGNYGRYIAISVAAP